MRPPAALKQALGGAIAMLAPQCDYRRALFIIGHMRCGSTALSNILVSRSDFSGYGEAHVRYADQAALGVLVLNQWRRGSWRPQAAQLFDKILHSQYDAAASPAFFGARAIFVARDPGATSVSIRSLFAALGSDEYASDEACADYYAERLATMAALWSRFAPDRRVAVTHAGLTADPEATLRHIGDRLGIAPPLRNAYVAPAAGGGRGAGDPLNAHRYNRIERTASNNARPAAMVLPVERLARLEALYRAFAGLADPTPDQAPGPMSS